MKNKYRFSFIFILTILIVFSALILINRRWLAYESMFIIYKLYSAFGYYAWNSPYPIDYPFDRKDLIPKHLMTEFNHICYYRQITGNNQYKKNEMIHLIQKIEDYCVNNLPIQKSTELTIFYPFQKEEDYEKMKRFIKNKCPFVIRGGNWKTNKINVNIQNIIEKYGDTHVMFDKNGETFTGNLKDIKTHKAYLSNSTSFMKKHPEIVDKTDIERITSISGMKHTISQIFLSLENNNGTQMHSAFSHNFFFMVEGKKKWTFWHPDYLCLTYPYFPKNGIYFGSYSGIRDMNDINANSKYKLLNYAPRYEIILEEGDVLFNPGPWWHSIRNITETSLAIATRWTYDELFPSTKQLQYCQLENPKIYKMFREVYINTGSFNFDVDENYNGEISENSLALVELLNHDSLMLLKDTFRYKNWYES